MDPSAPARGKQPTALSQQAYELLEEAIVSCALRPGRLLSILDLQATTGLGRTPTHSAVTKLAADTLIAIRPRHGLQISRVDLRRERTLLGLRRDLERFVVKLAIERISPRQRLEFEQFNARLRAISANDPVASFNRLDMRLNHLLLDAAGEPFLQHSLRPLHTMSRRTGWLFYSVVKPADGLRKTLDCHVAILDGVIAGRESATLTATDRLLDLSQAMLDTLARSGDPGLLDCTLDQSCGGGSI